MLPIQFEQVCFDQLPGLLMVALSCAVVVSLYYAAQWRWPFVKVLGSARSVAIGASVGLAVFQLTLWTLYLSSPMRNRLDLVVWGSALTIFGVAWLSLRKLARDGRRLEVDTAISLCQLVGLAGCAQLFTVPVEPANLPIDPPGNLVASAEIVGRTDLGTQIPLYQRELSKAEFDSFVQLSRPQMAGLTERAILKERPDIKSNCHGWVFTGGNFILRNDDVDPVLRENGYEQTSHPRLDDVVVYRDDRGQVIHTGKVCGFIGHTTPLVESKWGIDGIYIHRVDEQPYSQNFEFWRSHRPDHSLTILTCAQFNSGSLAAELDD